MLNGGGNSVGGNGVITVCVWCYCLVAKQAGYLTVRHRDGRAQRIWVRRMERDRLGGLGSPYALWNLVPACGPCNNGRRFAGFEIPEGCDFGPEVRERIERRRSAAELVGTEQFSESAPEEA